MFIEEPSPKAHREKMAAWFQKHMQSGHVTGGNALTLNGKQIKGRQAEVINDIHKTGTEIVGGYILLKATDWMKQLRLCGRSRFMNSTAMPK